MLGHKDNIDNLLYATSVEGGMLLLTTDEDFKRFLSRNRLKVDTLITHENLLERLVRPFSLSSIPYGRRA